MSKTTPEQLKQLVQDVKGSRLEQLLQDIEGSRLELGKTLDQVQEQTRPEALGARLQRTSINVTDRLEDMAMRKVDEMSNRVGEAITRKGNDLAQMVRTRPLPATLVGIGVGLLAASVRLGQGRRRRRGRSWDADTLRSEVADASTEFDERAGYMDSARSGARGANPLVVGLVAAALGVAIGLLIPTDRYKNGKLSEAGDRFAERVKEEAQEAAATARGAANTATQSIKAEAHKRGLTPEDLKKRVGAKDEEPAREAAEGTEGPDEDLAN